MPSTIRNLTERRVPQVLAVYLGAAFGVVQFVDFVGSRYLLPAVWTDLALLTMALLLPSVLLYTYNHGRPGPDAWRKSEKIFIPANLLALIGLVMFVGSGHSLGPTSQRITVKDEKGNTREAMVPNKAYRKRVALFMLDGASQDTSVQWLQYGIPLLITEDLAQQNFIEAWHPGYPSLHEGMAKAGFTKGTNAPLTLKREIARELHLPHFVTGKIEKSGSEFIVTTQLYDTESAKLIKENQFRGTDAAALADQASAALIRDLEVPVLADGAAELPVAEITSTNSTALRNYVEAAHAVNIDQDFARAFALNTAAVTADNTFANAHMLQVLLAMNSGKQEVTAASMKAAMDHSYRLPERSKELVKAAFYNTQGDYVRGFAVLDMLSQMYPEDIQIQTFMLNIMQVRDDRDGMIRTMEKILELDPSRIETLLQLAEVYESKGEGKKALEQLAAYEKKAPRDPSGPRRAALLHRKLGAHDAARAAFEKALLIKPDDPETLVDFASLERSIGDFAAAQKRLDEAAALAKTPSQRTKVASGLSGLQQFRAELRKSVATDYSALPDLVKTYGPAIALIQRINFPGRLAKVDAAAAKRELDQLHAELKPPYDIYLPAADMQYYIEMGDVANADRATSALEKLIKEQNFKIFVSLAHDARARISEIRGDCNAAIRSYQQSLELDPLDAATHAYMGRCYRKLGNRAKAQEELNLALRVAPAHGISNLEMGLLHKDAGDVAKARAYLNRAIQTWQNADPNYKPARQAREAFSTLK